MAPPRPRARFMCGGQPCEPIISPWSDVTTTIVFSSSPVSRSVRRMSPTQSSTAVQWA